MIQDASTALQNEQERFSSLAPDQRERLLRLLRERRETDGGEANKPGLLVAIQSAGCRRPLFLTHGLGGGVMGYAPLARLLSPLQPVYALRASGLYEGEAPFDDVREMAARYLDSVRAVQPHGPYLLGGFCLGGLIAYEMACQLERAGDQVDLLALLEAYAPPLARNPARIWRPSHAWALACNVPLALKDNLRWGLRPLVVPVLQRLGLWRKARALASRDRLPGPIDLVADLGPIASSTALANVRKAHVAAVSRYDPRPYGGCVHLFRVRAMRLLLAHDPLMGWAHLARGGLGVHRIAGAHHDFLKPPHVHTLATALQALLLAAQPSATALS